MLYHQSKTLKEYPAELSLSALVCFVGTIQTAVVALIMERNMSAWNIGFDSRFLAAAYSVSTNDIHNIITCRINFDTNNM